jgi:hypothetical protein
MRDAFTTLDDLQKIARSSTNSDPGTVSSGIREERKGEFMSRLVVYVMHDRINAC